MQGDRNINIMVAFLHRFNYFTNSILKVISEVTLGDEFNLTELKIKDVSAYPFVITIAYPLINKIES